MVYRLRAASERTMVLDEVLVRGQGIGQKVSVRAEARGARTWNQEKTRTVTLARSPSPAAIQMFLTSEARVVIAVFEEMKGVVARSKGAQGWNEIVDSRRQTLTPKGQRTDSSPRPQLLRQRRLPGTPSSPLLLAAHV